MSSTPENQNKKQRDRQYKCPCGKTYLSNPALYTHIRLKHDRVAPGKLVKPEKGKKPLGRPPKNRKIEENEKQEIHDKSEEGVSTMKQQTRGNNTYLPQYQQIVRHLNQIEEPQQPVNPQIWELNTFQLMSNYVENNNSQSTFVHEGICIGRGLSEFLKQTSQLFDRQPWKFQQILILFFLLLEFAIDQNNDANIIEKAPLQQLIDQMHFFMQDHIQDYSIYLNIDNLWIMQKQNMTKVFMCFYNWMKFKNYTHYCITLI